MSLISFRADLGCRVWPETKLGWYCIPREEDDVYHFDRIPDSVLLLVFNRIGDVKALGRCCTAVVFRNGFIIWCPKLITLWLGLIVWFQMMRTLQLVVRLISQEVLFPVYFVLCLVFGGIVKPLQALGQILGPKRSGLAAGSGDEDCEVDQGGVTHHSPIQVLKNFNEIRFLRIELPSGELGINDGVLLKWRADFGSTLDKCALLGVSSIVYPVANKETSLID